MNYKDSENLKQVKVKLERWHLSSFGLHNNSVDQQWCWPTMVLTNNAVDQQ